MKLLSKVNPFLAIVFICCGILYYLQNGIHYELIDLKPKTITKVKKSTRTIASTEFAPPLDVNSLKGNIFCQAYAEDCVNKTILQVMDVPGVDQKKMKTYKITCRVESDKVCLTKGKFTVDFETLEKRNEFIQQLRIYNRSVLEHPEKEIEQKKDQKEELENPQEISQYMDNPISPTQQELNDEQVENQHQVLTQQISEYSAEPSELESFHSSPEGEVTRSKYYAPNELEKEN